MVELFDNSINAGMLCLPWTDAVLPADMSIIQRGWFNTNVCCRAGKHAAAAAARRMNHMFSTFAVAIFRQHRDWRATTQRLGGDVAFLVALILPDLVCSGFYPPAAGSARGS